MSDHSTLLWVFLIAAVLIAVVFIVIYQSSLSAPEESSGLKDAKKKRFFFIAILAAVLLILLTVTLPKSPYLMHKDATPAAVVHVRAEQYSFNFSFTEELSYDDLELPAGEVVEFRVRAKDVTHGFGVYNDKYELVTQTQAMPGYVNVLRWVFDKPGTYHVLCLEYCGMSHHVMSSSFIVK